MTGKSSQGPPFLFRLSPLDTVLSRYMLPSRSRTPVVHTLSNKNQLERIMNVKIKTVKATSLVLHEASSHEDTMTGHNKSARINTFLGKGTIVS